MQHASSAASAGPEHGLFDPSAAGAHEAGPRRRRTHVRALRRGLVAFGPIACSLAGSRDKEALLPDDDSHILIGESLRVESGFPADDHAKVKDRLSPLARRLSGPGTKVPHEKYRT